MEKNMELTFENRLHLNKEAGYLVHSFGEGYSIIDEYGREVNTFIEEKEFNRLIKKFSYRHFLMKKLEERFGCKIEFRQDNVLFIDDKPVKGVYWNLPESEEDLNKYFEFIADKYVNVADNTAGNNNDI